MLYPWGMYLVFSLLSVVLTAVTMIIVTKRVIYPGMVGLFEEKYAMAEGAIKKGFSAMGTRSAELKKEKAMEGEIMVAVLDEYPELMMIAEKISPDMVAMIEEDPETALRLIDRYLPLLENLFPDLVAQFRSGQTKMPDYEL